jgi:hypothetical protein
MLWLASPERQNVPTPADVRKIAVSLDGVAEIDHFARPAWRTTKRIFAVMRPDGLFLHLPDERKEFLFEADPKTCVKYMWGQRPNVVVQIERVSRKELETLIREAWEFNRPIEKAKKVTKTPLRKAVKAKKAVGKTVRK